MIVKNYKYIKSKKCSDQPQGNLKNYNYDIAITVMVVKALGNLMLDQLII